MHLQYDSIAPYSRTDAGVRGNKYVPHHDVLAQDQTDRYPCNAQCIVVLCREAVPVRPVHEHPADVILPPDLPRPGAKAPPRAGRLSHRMVGKMAITTKMGALATPLYHMDTRKCEVVVWWVEMPPFDRNSHTMILMHYDIYRDELDETLSCAG
jgi:hypothetical protein